MANIFPGCADSVHNLNPKAKVCSEQHCDNFTERETFQDGCNTFGQGHPLHPASLEMPEGGTPFDPNGQVLIPPDAAQFLTDAQARDIVGNPAAIFRNLHNDVGFDVIKYLIKVFKGFYPDINIVVDQANPNFNTYAFEMYGQKYLVISGEIKRLAGLSAEGYKFIIAQGVARLLGNKPKDSQGFTYSAAADYYATSSVLREVFCLEWDGLTNKTLDQMKTVFGFIAEHNAASDPADLANNPSIKCRVDSMSTGFFGGNMLSCAFADLALLTVTTENAQADRLVVDLAFNKAINPDSIQDLYNFKLSTDAVDTRPAKVVSAQVDPADAKTILLVVDAPLNAEFKVTVEDLSSVGGSILGDQNSGTFKFSSGGVSP